MADTNSSPPPSRLAIALKIIPWLVAFAGWGWAMYGYLTKGGDAPPPPPPPPVWQPAPSDEFAPPAFGWQNEPAEVAAVVATVPNPVFGATPAGRVEDVPVSVYLWDAAKKVRGSHVPPRNQGSVGSCVSFGSACAVEYLQCVQIAAGKPAQFKDVAQEVIYGGSRVQIGQGRIRGDGSVGAWAAQWEQKYGTVARGVYGAIDLKEYSESRCRQYGSAGCPKELEPVARERPVKSIAPVRTAAELRAALASGYPVTVASSVGFGSSGPYVRNAKGQLRASGTWPHQMCFIGYDADSGFYCMNSWGPAWVSGPAGPGDPPPGGFYVAESTAARMLGEGDSWAYGDLVGFPSRRLDWFILDPRPAPAFRVAFRPAPFLTREVPLAW